MVRGSGGGSHGPEVMRSESVWVLHDDGEEGRKEVKTEKVVRRRTTRRRRERKEGGVYKEKKEGKRDVRSKKKKGKDRDVREERKWIEKEDRETEVGRGRGT